MKFWTLFIVVGFSLQFAHAQIKSTKAGINWSQEFMESKRFAFNNIVSCDTNGFYTLKTDARSRGNILIEYFDNQLNLTRSAEIQLNEEDKRATFEFILDLNDRLLVFTSSREPSEKKRLLFVQEIDKQKLQLIEGKTLLVESIIPFNSNQLIGQFDFKLASDSSSLLIYQPTALKEADSSEYNLYVYDQDLNQRWKKTIKLPIITELFYLEDIIVDLNAEIHFFGRQFNDEDESRFINSKDFIYTLFAIKEEKEEIDKIELHLEDIVITDMRIAFNNNNHLMGGGFYTEDGVIGIKGCFYITIDLTTQKLLKKSLSEFDDDFTNVNRIEKKGNQTIYKKPKGNDFDSFQYQLSDFIPKEDGGIILIGEQFDQNIVTNRIASFGGIAATSIDYIYSRDDLVVMNTSVEGDILWVEQISKSQNTKNDEGNYTSYALSIIDEDIYFVFNDNHKNLITNGGKNLKGFDKGRESLVVLAHLDGDGRQTREALFSLREAEFLTRPQFSKQTSDNELILFGQRRSTYRLARLRFE